jgi:hypothetical protein
LALQGFDRILDLIILNFNLQRILLYPVRKPRF